MNFYEYLLREGHTELAKKANPDGRMKPISSYMACLTRANSGRLSQEQEIEERELLGDLWTYWRTNLMFVEDS